MDLPIPEELVMGIGGAVAGAIFAMILRAMIKIVMYLLAFIGVLLGVLAYKGWITINYDVIEEDVINFVVAVKNMAMEKVATTNNIAFVAGFVAGMTYTLKKK